MSSVKVFHTADLHIGAEVSYLGNLAEKRRFEIASVFGSIVDTCLKNNVEICLIAGDLFDSNAAALEFAHSVLEYISSAKHIRFCLVLGNHDPLDALSPFKSKILPENLYVFGADYEIKEFEDIKVRVIGRSFVHSSMDTKDFSTVLPDDDFINIMLLHADVASDSKSPYNPINREFIENCGADYLALGHIHRRTKLAKFGETYFAYSGCPEGHGFDEEGVQGGYLGTVEKGKTDLSFIRLCRRIHKTEKIDVSSAASSLSAVNIILEKLSLDYGEGFENDLYKIILTGTLKEGVHLKTAEILQGLKDRLYFVKIIDNTRPEYNLDILKNEISLRGVFTKLMLERLEDAEEIEKENILSALYLGLSAFDSEVTYYED